MKIKAFAATSSRNSINKQLLACVCQHLAETHPQASIQQLDLNDFQLPLYSIDLENQQGIPEAAHRFLTEIQQSDALIISFAEHNGSYTAAYKNLFDWCSRITPKVYEGKPVLILGTSPGPGAASSVRAQAENSMTRFGGITADNIGLPRFAENFDPQAQGAQRISSAEHRQQILQAAEKLAAGE